MLEKLSSIAIAVHVDIEGVPSDDVWDIISDLTSWPEHFSTVTSVEWLNEHDHKKRGTTGSSTRGVVGSGGNKTARPSASAAKNSGGLRVGARFRLHRKTVQGESYSTELVVTQLEDGGATGRENDYCEYDNDDAATAASSSSSLAPPTRSFTLYSPSLAGANMSTSATWTVETLREEVAAAAGGRRMATGDRRTFVRATRTVAVIPHNVLVGVVGKVLWGPSLRKRAAAMARSQANDLVRAVEGQKKSACCT